jgi:hypothetical protein
VARVTLFFAAALPFQASAQTVHWIRQFGTTDDEGADVALDGSGNAYAFGGTLGTLPGQTSAGDYDAYVRKYDSAGTELWTRQFGTGASDGASGVAVDGGGNVYDQVHPSGIRIHTYGPHYFRANSEEIWEFVNRFFPKVYAVGEDVHQSPDGEHDEDPNDAPDDE